MTFDPPEPAPRYERFRLTYPLGNGGRAEAVSYEIILADPPSSYRDSANAGKRGAVHKYRTLCLPKICALDVPGIAAPNCLLALFTARNFPGGPYTIAIT
ncbi:MAG: hypothetical protein M3461_02865 [Pseudomonadota bacterium]|nr:hypothetical protein [Pseudomonadota bacterium]